MIVKNQSPSCARKKVLRRISVYYLACLMLMISFLGDNFVDPTDPEPGTQDLHSKGYVPKILFEFYFS